MRVNNIIHSFRLQSTSFDKKSYLAYLKGKASHNFRAFVTAISDMGWNIQRT